MTDLEQLHSDAQDDITDAIVDALHALDGDELALADMLREAMDSAPKLYRRELENTAATEEFDRAYRWE